MYHLDVDTVVVIHARVTHDSAVSPLLRRGALESAVHRTRQLDFYQPESDAVACAVALAVGISQAQAFLDGNKRTAYAAADTFLILNGLRFVGPPLTFARWLIGIAGDAGDEDVLEPPAAAFPVESMLDLVGRGRAEWVAGLEAWLRANVEPI